MRLDALAAFRNTSGNRNPNRTLDRRVALASSVTNNQIVFCLRVLINAVSAKSGGAETYIRNLVRDLPKGQPDYEYVVCVPSSMARELRHNSESIKVLGVNVGYQSAWKRFLWDQVRLRRIMKREKIDILFSSSDFGMLFSPCQQLLFVRNGLFFSDRFKFEILPRRRWQTRLKFRLQKLLLRMSIRCADRVMIASQDMFKRLRCTFPIPRNKAVVNYFGVPLTKFSPRREMEHSIDLIEKDESVIVPHNNLQISCISEYADYKDLGTLLKSIRIIGERTKRRMTFVLTIRATDLDHVDTVTRKEDWSLLNHSRVKPLLRLIGSVPYEHIESVYQDSDIFVFPSLVESFGHPLVEAMACGVPIIASDTLINREICGNAAVYFHCHDASDLARWISRVGEDVGLRRDLREKGILRARAVFDWERHITRLIGILDKMMRDRESRR